MNKVFEFDNEVMDISLEEFIEMNELSNEEIDDIRSMKVGDNYPFGIGGGGVIDFVRVQ